MVLDVGKSMREKYKIINCNQKSTLDINKFFDYPDFQIDLSDENLEIEKTPLYQKFDVILFSNKLIIFISKNFFHKDPIKI